jgi:hypothetical protein
MFASQAVPVFWLMGGLIFVPESPRWLAMMNRIGESLHVLARINGPTQAEKDLNDIQAELGDEEGDFSELFQPGVRKALSIGILLMIFSQICGATIIHMYAPTLFIASNQSAKQEVENVPAEKDSLAAADEHEVAAIREAILNNIYICSWASLCTISSFGVIRYLGRRPILIGGSIAMAAGHLMLYLCFMYHAPNMVTLAAMMFTSASFTLSLAPLSWVVLSEIFPNRVRGKAMSMATVLMFSLSFLAVYTFPLLMKWFIDNYGHLGGVFLIFLVICLVCAVFVWRMLPETKDKTLEEIGEFWLKRR